MAHEVETMAYAGALPWHGLGYEVSNDLTPQQMKVAAGCDWTVDKYPLTAEVNGLTIATDRQALIRSSDDSLLSVVGDDWNPVQNDDAFEFFSEFVLAGDMEMHTAGSLKNGQIVWALAKTKKSFEVVKGDNVESFLLFNNPHVYGKSLSIFFTPIRVVCNNTLTYALNSSGKSAFKMGHRSTFDPDMVKKTLGIADLYNEEYKELAQFLASKPFTVDGLIEFYSDTFPHTNSSKQKEIKSLDDMSRNAKKSYEVLQSQPGSDFAPGSWWQAFNSVTYTVDHTLGRNEENRMSSALFGTGADKKSKAMKKALELAKI